MYAYFQTFTQQRDAGALSAQIDVLRNIILQSGESQSDFSAELGRLADISEKIDRVISLGESSSQTTTELRGEMRETLAELSKEKRKKSPASRIATTSLDVGKVAKTLAESAYSLQLTLYAALIAGAEVGKDMSAVKSDFIDPAINEQQKGWVSGYLSGFINALWYVLLDLDIFVIEGVEKIGTVDQTFKRLIEDKFDVLVRDNKSHEWLDAKVVKVLIEAARAPSLAS